MGRALDPMAGMFDEMEPVLDEAEGGIVAALARVGNIRLDSATVVFSNDMGTEEASPYVCLILEGLYDPARLRRLCTEGIGEPIEIEGHAVFHEGGDPAVCLIDEHTAIISFGPGWGPRHMERVLQGMAARENTPLPAHVAPAFDLIAWHQARMAGSGAYSDAQKAMIEEELAQMEQDAGPEPEAQMELETLRIGLALATVDLLEGYWALDGKLTLTATCPDADAAAALAAPVTRLEELLREQITASMADVPERLKVLFPDVMAGAKLWEITARDRQVTLRADTKLLTTLLMGLTTQGASVHVRLDAEADDSP